MKINNTDIEKFLTPLNIDKLNSIQQASLEQYTSEKDMMLLAPTGTGKTLAFLLPVLGQVRPNLDKVQVLILVPSRELSIQLEQVFKAMSTGFKINCCYGGHSFKTEKNNLQHPPSVLVGTPGRIADHLNRRSFETDSIHTIILDEFDKSLELGFEEDMESIIRRIPHLKSRILTSATEMKKIPGFVKFSDPVLINHLSQHPAPKIELVHLPTDSASKLETLFQLICHIGAQPMLVFCNHREAVDRISDLLFERGIIHEIFHGGMDQEERERALLKFRNGSHYLLVTTDLAARGLDIPQIRHIIHYQLPSKEDAFIHRNGRTARMNACGTAYLITTENDEIPAYIHKDVPEMPLTADAPIPDEPEWETLFISAGKKSKINKIDIVGLFLKAGGLQKDDLGLIEVKDQFAYAAVKRNMVKALLPKVNNQKVKKQKLRIQVAK
ncbi:DEAD/DEAH box helicase [Fulvivirga sp. 29W222]|uniref:DEAD/DEAH box helicase n=1 Tax=Fulvivirga marina TaxID=2494733 RepID=A0A937FZ96_9BACT|nr:DEAD/DEAH box helicase [Fulvivirga marina]MBL6445631.1 DEAD/DEAH box helicase [Fulvivirga marina]